MAVPSPTELAKAHLSTRVTQSDGADIDRQSSKQTKMAKGAQKVSPYLLLLVGISTLGPLQFGFHLAELNAPQDVMTCQRDAVTTPVSSTLARRALADCIPMTPATFATISSIYTIGALLGALAAGPVSSRRGRVSAMRLTAVFFLVGSMVESVAPGVTLLAAGRLLAGIGGGASTVVVPLYISEVAPPAGRGFFGTATQVGINVGILATQTLGYFLSHGGAWRWILAAGAAFAVAHAVGLGLAVESPAWMAGVGGDATAARKTLQRIRGRGVDVDDEARAWGGAVAVPEGVSEAEGLLASDNPPVVPALVAGKHDKQHLGFMDVARDPLYRPAIIAVVGIMFAQQFCGINSIIMYSVSLLAGVLPISSSLMTIAISLVNLFATVAFSPLPDRLGRKTCLLLSIFGQGTSSLVLAFSILFGVKTLSAIAVLLFVASFAAGLGPVPFILASELVGVEAVGATQSWALGANYVATFMIAQFFPILNDAINRRLGGAGWVYFIFAACALLFGGFVGWRVPETKGKKDADEVWGRARRID